MPAGIASSAHKNHPTQPFGLIPTVESAIEKHIDAVQLYLNDQFANDQTYLLELVKQLLNYPGTIVIHFPDNYWEVTATHIHAAEYIMSMLPDRYIRVLTHYTEGMTVDDIPKVNDKPVGIENSKTQVFDPVHVRKAFELARAAGTFFVFDFGRIVYIKDNDVTPEVIYAFIRQMLQELDPVLDVVHAADKTDWEKRFRDCWTYIGDPNGLCYPLIDDLKAFVNKGGTLILEHESLELAVESVVCLEN